MLAGISFEDKPNCIRNYNYRQSRYCSIPRLSFFLIRYTDLDAESIEAALALGPSSLEYTKLVSFLSKQLSGFYDIPEYVNPITGKSPIWTDHGRP